MPNHEEHCLHSEQRYGAHGDDIHAWKDEPCKISGQGHHVYRHSLSDLPMVVKLFGQRYGEDMAEQIFLDQLQADADEYRKSRIEQKQEIHTEPYLDFILNKPEMKMFRYKRKRRTVKISFKNPRKGQKLGLIIRVSGGNNDVSTSIGMIRGEQSLEPVLPMHPLIISNVFSVWDR